MGLKLSELSLLYVEDDNDIREELAEFLRPRVKELLLAENGRKGLEVYKKHKPHLVVTDIKMPEMNGLEMAREIRRVERNSLILITTAYKDTEFFLEAIDLGVNQFVLKPIILERLMKSIDKCVCLLNGEECY